LADLVVGSVEDLEDLVVEVLAVAVEALVEAEPQGGGRISFSYSRNRFISILRSDNLGYNNAMVLGIYDDRNIR
jgi:hypothetical protein